MPRFQNKVTPMQTKATPQSIYDELKRMIMDFEIVPGARFTETQIADYFKVSRTPVRAALQRLELEGQLSIKPKQGCFVRSIDLLQISHYYDVRVALEIMAVQEAMAQGDRAAIEALGQKWDPAQKRFGEEISEALKQEEEQFHIELARASRNPVLVSYLDDINHHIRAVRRLGWPDQVSVDDTYEEHYRICQLMLAGRTEDAVAEMINHIRKSQDLASRVTLKQIYSQRRGISFEDA